MTDFLSFGNKALGMRKMKRAQFAIIKFCCKMRLKEEKDKLVFQITQVIMES